MSLAIDLKIIFVNIKVVPSRDSLNTCLALYGSEITRVEYPYINTSVDLKINKLHSQAVLIM